ncbi:hypothetical protein X759_03565 [Mesorhizobium sp. LSHC420B00]|nr:hypothetical protein X759_03565 [Mesorhizobium sp. LSHC420B00]
MIDCNWRRASEWAKVDMSDIDQKNNKAPR